MNPEEEGKTGFFVKITATEYDGPFINLKGARDRARSIGPNKEIYHGVLKITARGIDDSDIHLIPKVKK